MVRPPLYTGANHNEPREELIRKSVIASLIVGAVLATAAQAQQAAAPAPVPDQMPFDVPYGESISLAKAEKAIAATIADATKSPRNWKLSIAVVDPSGELVALHKMDQTQVASVGISIAKARTAARFRRESAVFAALMGTPAGAFVPTLAIRPRPRRPAASRWSKAARSSGRSDAAARPVRRISSPARPAQRRSSSRYAGGAPLPLAGRERCQSRP